MHPYLQSLLGGVLIGLASWLLLFTLGRVAGISGIASGLLVPHAVPRSDRAWRWAFVVGLVGAGAVMAGLMAQPHIAQRPVLLLVAAGLLVGYGTVTGSGCTSGHGVCGLGRRSLRSLAATLVFMGLGMATVAVAKVLVA
jgi:uncharacterized membrane protein YedE/YeeE